MTTDASEVPTRPPPTTSSQDERPRRRRTRPPRVEVPDYTSGHESETTNGNLTDSSILSERRTRESMAERMQRRRKSQVNMEEIQNNLSKIESQRQRSREDSTEQQGGVEEVRDRRVRVGVHVTSKSNHRAALLLVMVTGKMVNDPFHFQVADPRRTLGMVNFFDFPAVCSDNFVKQQVDTPFPLVLEILDQYCFLSSFCAPHEVGLPRNKLKVTSFHVFTWVMLTYFGITFSTASHLQGKHSFLIDP